MKFIDDMFKRKDGTWDKTKMMAVGGFIEAVYLANRAINTPGTDLEKTSWLVFAFLSLTGINVWKRHLEKKDQETTDGQNPSDPKEPMEQ